MVHDPVFWSSVRLTLIFVIGSGIVAQTVLGLALALLGQRAHVTVRTSVGAIVILAWVLPEIAVAFIWYAFAQAGGTLSYLIGNPKNNLLSTAPLLIVCVANAWRGTAFSMLVLSAGLRNVPAEVDEAAQLEGASYWRRLLRVTLPIMRPTIMTNMLLITLGTISDFTLIFVMTQGGPGKRDGDPAGLHVHRGLPVQCPRVRHGDRAGHRAHRRAALDRLHPPAPARAGQGQGSLEMERRPRT